MFVLEVLLQFALPLPLTLHALDEPPPLTDESQKLVRRLNNIKPLFAGLNASFYRFWLLTLFHQAINLLYFQDCQP